MRARPLFAACSVAVAIVVLAAVSTAQAALMLEYDFRTNQNASYTAGGITTGATLQGTTTVNAGGAAVNGTLPNYTVDPRLQTGFMDVTTATGGNLLGATWQQVFGSNINFGNGTVVAVMKPDFGPSGSRRYIWGMGGDGGVSYISGISQGRMELNGGRGTENAFNLWDNITGTGNFPWDTNTWYMVATSWQQSSGPSATPGPVSGFLGLPDGKLRIYVRALQSSGLLTPDSASIYATDEAVAVWNPRLAAAPFSGTFRQANRAIFTEGGIGDYALFQYYNSTFNQADFDNLFSTFIAPVPEPSSFMLSLLGLGFIRAARRKRAAA